MKTASFETLTPEQATQIVENGGLVVTLSDEIWWVVIKLNTARSCGARVSG